MYGMLHSISKNGKVQSDAILPETGITVVYTIPVLTMEPVKIAQGKLIMS